MSFDQRSNSGVRNLRSIFENKFSDDSPSARGRSPTGGLSPDREARRPRSKIRSSFFAVEPVMDAVARDQQNNVDDVPTSDVERAKREGSAGQRRGSISEGHSGDAVDLLKDTVTHEEDRREKESSAADTIPETAVESAAPNALVEVKKQPQTSTSSGPTIPAQKEDKEPENPDKPVTGAEEEPADMKPADPTSESAVSGGDALPPVAEDLRKTASGDKKDTITKSAVARTSNLKHSSNSTKSSTKPTPRATQAPLSPPIPKGPTKKTSRTSLTAPTAASVARAAAADKSALSTSKGPSVPPKPKPREVTKSAELPSRLTAPTAASRARLEPAAAAVDAKPKPPTTAIRSKPTTSSTRPSLGRPESRSSQTSSRKTTTSVDSSFLERMMRPTAASSSKVHDKQEKSEVRSPPRKQPPLRQNANGHPKSHRPANTSAPAENEHEMEQSTTLSLTAGADGTLSPAHEPAVEGPSEAHTNGYEKDATTLETTPAALGATSSVH